MSPFNEEEFARILLAAMEEPTPLPNVEAELEADPAAVLAAVSAAVPAAIPAAVPVAVPAAVPVAVPAVPTIPTAHQEGYAGYTPGYMDGSTLAAHMAAQPTAAAAAAVGSSMGPNHLQGPAHGFPCPCRCRWPNPCPCRPLLSRPQEHPAPKTRPAPKGKVSKPPPRKRRSKALEERIAKSCEETLANRQAVVSSWQEQCSQMPAAQQSPLPAYLPIQHGYPQPATSTPSPFLDLEPAPDVRSWNEWSQPAPDAQFGYSYSQPQFGSFQ
ncbi:hypothetical protein HD806DRAFT_485503 [Xylariaceae sp. AK1471]|nr:hypothetical protein HD806DRAFT_485503 [Xylariaceae sp. AK1471]